MNYAIADKKSKIIVILFGNIKNYFVSLQSNKIDNDMGRGNNHRIVDDIIYIVFLITIIIVLVIWTWIPERYMFC